MLPYDKWLQEQILSIGDLDQVTVVNDIFYMLLVKIILCIRSYESHQDSWFSFVWHRTKFCRMVKDLGKEFALGI